VGVVFCTIVLVTGPIWARPVWGIWWAPGDIRLTSTLVLWLIYVSYLVLRRFSDSAQTQKLAAVLAVFGALDVPLVYFSIWFFRTQHPATRDRRRWFDGPADVTRAADQLAGILMFRVSGLLVEVPAGKAAARGGGSFMPSSRWRAPKMGRGRQEQPASH